MERIKLSEPGEELVMAIEDVKIETIENTAYLKFVGQGKELLVPMQSVERQFERMGVDSHEELAGKGVKFSRSTKLSKYGKPFWNCDLASKAELLALDYPPKPSKRLTGPASVPGDAPDVPPPTDADAPPVGFPFRAAIGAHLADDRAATGQVGGKEAAYCELFERIARFQAKLAAELEMPFDAASVNAQTFSIFNQR